MDVSGCAMARGCGVYRAVCLAALFVGVGAGGLAPVAAEQEAWPPAWWPHAMGPTVGDIEQEYGLPANTLRNWAVVRGADGTLNGAGGNLDDLQGGQIGPLGGVFRGAYITQTGDIISSYEARWGRSVDLSAIAIVTPDGYRWVRGVLDRDSGQRRYLPWGFQRAAGQGASPDWEGIRTRWSQSRYVVGDEAGLPPDEKPFQERWPAYWYPGSLGPTVADIAEVWGFPTDSLTDFIGYCSSDRRITWHPWSSGTSMDIDGQYLSTNYTSKVAPATYLQNTHDVIGATEALYFNNVHGVGMAICTPKGWRWVRLFVSELTTGKLIPYGWPDGTRDWVALGNKWGLGWWGDGTKSNNTGEEGGMTEVDKDWWNKTRDNWRGWILAEVAKLKTWYEGLWKADDTHVAVLATTKDQFKDWGPVQYSTQISQGFKTAAVVGGHGDMDTDAPEFHALWFGHVAPPPGLPEGPGVPYQAEWNSGKALPAGWRTAVRAATGWLCVLGFGVFLLRRFTARPVV